MCDDTTIRSVAAGAGQGARCEDEIVKLTTMITYNLLQGGVLAVSTDRNDHPAF
jgi:hypothetical protein